MRKVFILFTLICLSGCATWGIITDSDKDFQAAAALVKVNNFPEGLRAYDKIVSDRPHSAPAADSLFEIALIHAHPDNPAKDYAMAIQTFEKFIERYSDHKKAAEARTWISALKTLQELKEQIEQLMRIDIRHEERRRGK